MKNCFISENENRSQDEGDTERGLPAVFKVTREIFDEQSLFVRESPDDPDSDHNCSDKGLPPSPSAASAYIRWRKSVLAGYDNSLVFSEHYDR
jgi:hypothetical protein